MPALRLVGYAVLIALVMAGCSGNNQEGRPFKLPSGHEIRILSVTPLHYAGGAPPSLMLRYQTDVKTTDKLALRKEVDDIWQVFQVDAERGNFTSAIVSANEMPSGFILKKSKGYNFVYEKHADGTWHCLDDEKAGPN